MLTKRKDIFESLCHMKVVLERSAARSNREAGPSFAKSAPLRMSVVVNADVFQT